MRKLIFLSISLIFLTSCGERRLVKKFVLRFNAGNYSKATKYISPASRRDYAEFCAKFCNDPAFQPQINTLINKPGPVDGSRHFRFSFSNSPKNLTSQYGEVVDINLNFREIGGDKYIDFPFKDTSTKKILGICNTQTLNIREKPSPASAVIGTITLNQEFEIIDTANPEWIKGSFIVSGGSQAGFVSKSFVNISSDQDSYINEIINLKWYQSMGLLFIIIIAIIVLCVLLIGAFIPFVGGGQGFLVGMGIVALSAFAIWIIFDMFEQLFFELFLIQI
jgi:hypothetical protein